MFTKIKSYIESIVRPSPGSFEEIMAADTWLYPHSPPSPYNPDQLVTIKGGLIIYDKMRKDDAIKACLGLKKYAILSSGWTIDSAVEEDKDEEANKEVAEFVKDNFNAMKGSFDDVLLQIMTGFDYGFSVTEKIFKIKENMVALGALKTRKPHGITFQTDKFGNLEDDGVIQAHSDHFSPKKFIIFVNNPEFNNWFGESDLRNCYRAWWSKDNIIKFWNMYLERYSMPPVVGKIKAPLANEASDKIKLQNVLKRLQTATSALIPEGIDVDFLETKGKGAVSYKDAVEKHDMAIARALLVPNLLGLSAQGDTGSYSQSKTHFNVFLWIILRLRRSLEELINEELIKELVDYNFRVKKYPVFKFLPLDDDRKIEISKLWIQAVDKGTVTSDEEDENLFRKVLGWPEKEIDKEKKAEKDKIEATSDKKKKDEEEDKKNNTVVVNANTIIDKFDSEKFESFVKLIKQGKQIKNFEIDRSLTKYEKKVDFAKIEKSLNKLEEEANEKIVDILTDQMETLKSFLEKKITSGSLTPKLINNLQLKNLRSLQQTIKETLRESYRLGQEQLSKELNKKKYQKIPPVYAIDWLTNKSFYIKGVIESSILNRVKGTLLNSLETGEPMKETLLKVEKIYQPYIGTDIISDLKQVTPYRIDTMIRTNTTGAFNNGRVAMSYDKDLKDYIIAFQFSAVIDDRTSMVCMELDEKIIRKDDPDFDRFVPPMHFNCFIDGQVPIYTSRGWKPIGDIELGDLILTHKGKFKPATFIHHKQKPVKYGGEVVKIFVNVKKRSGKGFIKKFITVTPGHPVLTSRGWIKAGEINRKDKIIVSAFKCQVCGEITPWVGSEMPKYCSKSCAVENSPMINWSEDRKKKQSKMTSKQLKREYKNGVRNGSEITKQAHIRTRELYAKGNFGLQRKDVREKAYNARIKSKKWIKSVTVDRMGDKNVMRRPEVALKQSKSQKLHWLKNPERHPNRIMGRAIMKGQMGYISKGQLKLYQLIKKMFLNVEVEYPIKVGDKLYFLDVAIPKHKIDFEFDGSYWHSKLRAKRKDKQRDKGLTKEGWNVVRYRNVVPPRKEIRNEINRIMMNHNDKYLFTEIEVVNIKRWKLKKPKRLYNISVEDHESYIAKGFVVHNCRSILVPVTTDDKPFKSITRDNADRALALTPEEFGGRVGGATPISKIEREKIILSKIKSRSILDNSKDKKLENIFHEIYDNPKQWDLSWGISENNIFTFDGKKQDKISGWLKFARIKTNKIDDTLTANFDVRKNAKQKTSILRKLFQEFSGEVDKMKGVKYFKSEFATEEGLKAGQIIAKRLGLKLKTVKTGYQIYCMLEEE